jgi:hypothetical protein
MTVVDRPTISEQFFGQFHAHGFPNRWKTPSTYIYFCTRPRRTMGIDIGKNSFHVVGLDQRGAIVLRQKWSRRPDTLMQDRRADRSTKPSCDARPDHTFGSISVAELRGQRRQVLPRNRRSRQLDGTSANVGQNEPSKHVRAGDSFRRKRPWYPPRHGHTTTISVRAANDPRQHARQRRAVARCVLLAVSPSCDHECGPVARPHASAIVRPAYGVHPMWHYWCRRPESLTRVQWR